MRTKIVKQIVLLLSFLLLVCLNSVESFAAVAIQSELVSGIIIQKDETQAIKLDNGKIYQPSREGLSVDVKINEPVTLRYVETTTGEYVYFDYAPGMNSLQALPSPANKVDKKAK